MNAEHDYGSLRTKALIQLLVQKNVWTVCHHQRPQRAVKRAVAVVTILGKGEDGSSLRIPRVIPDGAAAEVACPSTMQCDDMQQLINAAIDCT